MSLRSDYMFKRANPFAAAWRMARSAGTMRNGLVRPLSAMQSLTAPASVALNGAVAADQYRQGNYVRGTMAAANGALSGLAPVSSLGKFLQVSRDAANRSKYHPTGNGLAFGQDRWAARGLSAGERAAGKARLTSTPAAMLQAINQGQGRWGDRVATGVTRVADKLPTLDRAARAVAGNRYTLALNDPAGGLGIAGTAALYSLLNANTAAGTRDLSIRNPEALQAAVGPESLAGRMRTAVNPAIATLTAPMQAGGTAAADLYRTLTGAPTSSAFNAQAPTAVKAHEQLNSMYGQLSPDDAEQMHALAVRGITAEQIAAGLPKDIDPAYRAQLLHIAALQDSLAAANFPRARYNPSSINPRTHTGSTADNGLSRDLTGIASGTFGGAYNPGYLPYFMGSK